MCEDGPKDGTPCVYACWLTDIHIVFLKVYCCTTDDNP